MVKQMVVSVMAVALSAALISCGGTTSRGDDPGTKGSLEAQVNETIMLFKSRDRSIGSWFDSAYGYVVFPDVVEGAFIVGGGHGRGLVYRNGELMGSATVTQVDVGLQAGGQAFREVIFFKDEIAFATFAGSNLEFAADASAVLVKSGAAATADYENGVAAFTMPRGGAMAKAAIGGQKFKYNPLQK